jgi:hypothetical protein
MEQTLLPGHLRYNRNTFGHLFRCQAASGNSAAMFSLHHAMQIAQNFSQHEPTLFSGIRALNFAIKGK